MASTENEESTKQNNKETTTSTNLQELSEVWRELLGALPVEAQTKMLEGSGTTPARPQQGTQDIPLPGDPWGQLLHAEGIRIVDLQQAQVQIKHARLSEKDVEQALQVLQEEQET